jgi:hypothetical protein
MGFTARLPSSDCPVKRRERAFLTIPRILRYVTGRGAGRIPRSGEIGLKRRPRNKHATRGSRDNTVILLTKRQAVEERVSAASAEDPRDTAPGAFRGRTP